MRKSRNNPKSGQDQGLRDEELDSILMKEDSLLPSSGFAASVMREIEQQAAEPSPIRFPWKLAIPGFAAIAVGFGILVWLAVTTFQETRTLGGQADFLPRPHVEFLPELAMHNSLSQAALALAGAWLCVLLARKMTG